MSANVSCTSLQAPKEQGPQLFSPVFLAPSQEYSWGEKEWIQATWEVAHTASEELKHLDLNHSAVTYDQCEP